MKTAILISGQCRTLDVCARNIAEQVLRFFPGADLWISVAAGPDTEQARFLEAVGLPVRLLETVEQPVFDERDYQVQSSGGSYYIGEGPHDSTAVQRILCQAWQLRRVYEKACASGEEYGVYVRLRPDQWFTVGAAGWPEITPSTAALPWWGNFGGVNDRFAILGSAAAEAYCWWPYLDQLLAEGCRFHPETLTRFALERAQCRIVRLPVLAATLKRDPSGNIVIREPEILPDEMTPMVPL